MDNSKDDASAILVIDDEEGMREGCRRALMSAGHCVDTAPDLATAQELMHHHAYALYLLDVMLPDGNGLDFIASILDHDPDAVCIIITGFGSIEVAVAAVREGAYDFLSKPFTADELIMATNQGLEHRRLKAVEAQAEELTRAKAELEKLDQAKSQLMLKVAHELRAPTAAVQSYINLLLAGYISGQETKPVLIRIQQRLQEMLDLVADLLELARLKQAGDPLSSQTSPQDMAAILNQVAELFREQAVEKKQSFEIEIADRPTIIANPEHLKQIWTNLLSNAIKYTPEGGHISARLQSDQDFLRGMVEDSGIGISEKDLPNLFQEFFRSDQAKASGQIGTGLGLSIVKQIVDSYGGKMEVDSKAGQGSRFTFILPLRPLAPKVAEPVAKTVPVQEQGRQERYQAVAPRSVEFGTRPARSATHARSLVMGSDSTPEEKPPSNRPAGRE